MAHFIPSKGRTSHVYTLKHRVNGRNTVPADTNACRAMLERHRDDLPADLAREFDAYLDVEAARGESLRVWCEEFIEDCYNGGPYTTRKGTLIHSWTDAAGRLDPEINIPMLVLYYLVTEGDCTHKDLKSFYGIASDGFGGFLSAATKVGAIACLEETR